VTLGELVGLVLAAGGVCGLIILAVNPQWRPPKHKEEK
jgi:hypothetical protein